MQENPLGYFLSREGPSLKNKIVNLFHKELLLGREEGRAKITLISNVVSRQHCLIELELEKMFVTDIKSSNGTFVNGRKIVKKTEVTEGDSIGIGCNDASFKKNENNEAYFLFKVKTGYVMDTVDLLDSDDETVEATTRTDIEPSIEQTTEAKVEEKAKQVIIYEEQADMTMHDVDELCDELVKNSGIEVQNIMFDDFIEISDEEDEESKQKSWGEKLSQGHSKSPTFNTSSHLIDQSDSNSSHVEILQNELLQSETLISENNNKVLETSERPLSVEIQQDDDKNSTPAVSDLFVHQNPIAINSSASPQAPPLVNDIKQYNLREFSVQLSTLSKKEVEKYISHESSSEGISSDESSSEETLPDEPKLRIKISRKSSVLPSIKKIRKDALKIRKRLSSICDKDEELQKNERKPKLNRKTTNTTPKKKLPEPKINLLTEAHQSLQDEIFGEHIAVEAKPGIKSILRIPKKTLSRSDEQDALEQNGKKDGKSSPRVQDIPKPPKPMPKRRMTISEVTEKINIPAKKAVQIIEPPMKKRRFSTAAPSRQIQLINAEPIRVARKRRQSVNDSDMFQIAASVRDDGVEANRQRPQINTSSLESKQLLRERRCESLKRIAENHKLKNLHENDGKGTEENNNRARIKPKVKVTLKNRGDHLAETLLAPQAAPPKKVVVNLPETTTKRPTQNAQKYGDNSKNLNVDYPKAVSPTFKTLLSKFQEQHVSPSVNIFSTKTDASSVESEVDGSCNNIDFYTQNKLNISLPSTTPALGFYQQLAFSQKASTPFIPDEAEQRPRKSILKNLGEPRNKDKKKKVSFPEDETKLMQIKTFIREERKQCDELEQPYLLNVGEQKEQLNEDDIISKILKWDTSLLLNLSQSLDDSYSDLFKNLLTKIQIAYSTKYLNDTLIHWSSHIVTEQKLQENGFVRLVLLSRDSHRGLRPGSLLLIKIISPKDMVEYEKFAYICDHSTYHYKTKIVVQTNLKMNEVNGVKITKTRSIIHLTSELKSLLQADNIQF